MINRFDIRELQAVRQVIISGKLSRFFQSFKGGPNVQAFEEEFADYLGVQHAISVCNGTLSLEDALTSLGVGVGDEVITTPLTFIATATSIIRVGANPVFADIDANTLNISPDKIMEAITPKTKALMPVSLLGYPAEMPQIMKIAADHGLYVIEDAAQALGATVDGKKIGSFGDLGCFDPRVIIKTINGQRKIKHIKIGDLVLTEKGYRKVIAVQRREYYGDCVKIWFGKKTSECRLTATENHPIKVWRAGQDQWLSIKNVQVGDFVYVLTRKCLICSSKIPFYHKLCLNCNSSQMDSARKKQSKNRLKGRKSLEKKQTKHYANDILPYAQKLEKEGWRAIPIGFIIPDIIAIKDGKVVAFEIENKITPRQHKIESYKKVHHLYDEVKWITLENHPHKLKRPYAIVGELARVPVIAVERFKYKPRGKKWRKFVYNLTVEDSPTYFAKRVLVHNSFSLQETKQITSLGEGGMIVTDDELLAERCRHIRNHGNCYGSLTNFTICSNHRMSEAAAAFGRIQLSKLDGFNKIQIENAEYFLNQIKSPLEQVYFKSVHLNPSSLQPIYLLIPVFLNPDSAISRDQLIKHLTEKNVSKGIPGQNVGYYKKLIYDYPLLRIFKTECPIAEWVINHLILFDVHRWRTKGEMDKVLKVLAKLFG